MKKLLSILLLNLLLVGGMYAASEIKFRVHLATGCEHMGKIATGTSATSPGSYGTSCIDYNGSATTCKDYIVYHMHGNKSKPGYIYAKSVDASLYYFVGWSTTNKAADATITANPYCPVGQPTANACDNTSYSGPSNFYAHFAEIKQWDIVLKAVAEGGSYTAQHTVNGKSETHELMTTSSDVTEPTMNKPEDIVYTLKATSAPNFKFLRWKIEYEDGTVAYNNHASTDFTFAQSGSLSCEFISNEYAQFILLNQPNNSYFKLSDAIAAAVESSSKVIAVKESGKLFKETTTVQYYDADRNEYTIPSGVTLLVPGDENYTVQMGDLDEDDFIVRGTIDWYKEEKKLTISDEQDFIVRGNMCIYAQVHANGGAMGSPYRYGWLELGENSEITIKSGGKLSVLGYITGENSSSITVEAGGSVRELLQIADWRGGEAVSKMVPTNSNKVFPINQYYIQNIETKLVLKYGAYHYVSSGCDVTLVGVVPINTQLIVPNNATSGGGLFRLDPNTELLKYYDATTDRQKYEICLVEGATEALPEWGSIEMKLNLGLQGSTSLKSQDFVMPVNNNMDVTIKTRVTLTIGYDVCILAGGKITIEEGAKVKTSNNARIYVYDADQHYVTCTQNMGDAIQITKDTKYNYFGAGNYALYPVLHRPGTLYNRSNDLLEVVASNVKKPNSDASIVVDGEFEGGLYTTGEGKNRACIISTKNGKVNFNHQLSEGILTYQAIEYADKGLLGSNSEKVRYEAIPVTPAALLNADGTYSAGSDATSENSRCYTYYKNAPNDNGPAGKWLYFVQDGEIVVESSGDEITLTIPEPKDTRVEVTPVTENVDIIEIESIEIKGFQFARTEDNYTWENNKLTVPLIFTPTTNHGSTTKETMTVTFACKLGDSGVELKSVDIELKAEENYIPSFKINDKESEKLTFNTTVNASSEPQTITINTDDNNVTDFTYNKGNSYVTWEMSPLPDGSPFTLTGDPKTGYQVTYSPKTTNGTPHSQTLNLTATYSEGVNLSRTITLEGRPTLADNPLAFADREININESGTIYPLFSSKGNSNPIILQYNGKENSEIVEIDLAGNTLKVKNDVQLISEQTITIEATQDGDDVTRAGYTKIVVTITPSVQWLYPAMYFGETYNNIIKVWNSADEWELKYNHDCPVVTFSGDVANGFTAVIDAGEECKASFEFTQGGWSTTFYTDIYSDPRILPICMRDDKAERTFNGVTLLDETSKVEYNEGILFATTRSSGAAWTMELQGVPDKMEFVPQGQGKRWTIQEYDGTNWTTTYTEAEISLAEGQIYFTHNLQPSTQRIRIVCSLGDTQGRITDLCVTALDAAANADKDIVYLPITKNETGAITTSEQSFMLNYVSPNSLLSLQLVDNNNKPISGITLESENLNENNLPATNSENLYASEEIIVKNISHSNEGIVYLLVRDESNELKLKLPIRLYHYPQPLPMRSAEWSGENAEKYRFYATEHQQNVQFDAVTQKFTFAGTNQRFVTFAFRGGPSYISFESSLDITPQDDITPEKLVLQEWYNYWTLEVTDGESNTLVANNAEAEVQPEIIAQVRDGKTFYQIRIPVPYTTKSMTLESKRAVAVEVENIIIDGEPDLDVVLDNHTIEHYSEANFTTDSPQDVIVTAINLNTLKVFCNNPNFTVKLGETTISSTPIELTASHCPNALGGYIVGNISFEVTWNTKNAVEEGVLTFTNANDEVLANIRLLGTKDFILKPNANQTGLYTGFAKSITSHPFQDVAEDRYKYARRQVDLSNTFDKNGIALFDYLIVYGETTVQSGTTITPPTTSAGSNAITPYYIYRKAQNSDGIYDRYQIVANEANTNQGHKTILSNVVDAEGKQLIPHAKNVVSDQSNVNLWEIGANDHLKVYVTGFCPYASVGFTKDEEGVWLFRGKENSKLDLYLENCHIYSRNKTEDGHVFTGKEDPKANTFKGDFAQGSGGVFVFECDKKDQNPSATAFEVTVHTRGNNLLKSNNGCFYEVYGMRAYQVSSPMQVHLMPFNGKQQVLASKTHLTFDDLWPTEEKSETIDEKVQISYKTIRTNGFLSLQKQHNNAPSIDMGNTNTVVNFHGGRVELENAQNVSDKYKTTLAISYRSGIMAAGGIEVQMAYGIGTDEAKGGRVNFYDGTITVIPMKVDVLNQQYYLMDPELTADGEELKDANGQVVRTNMTSCLRCPEETYVYGGSICMLRACMSPTSKGGAPTDGTRILGRYIYKEALGYEYYNTNDGNKPAADADARQWLVKPEQFPSQTSLFEGLYDYYKNIAKYPNQMYGLESVTPNKDGNLVLWIPDGYANVKAEEDRYLVPWKACMTEIKAVLGSAGVMEIAGEIGGDVEFENNEDVDNLLYCHLDNYVHEVISAHTGSDTDPVYTYEAPIKVPDGFKMEGVTLFGDYIKQKPSHVGDRLYQVTNMGTYKVNSKVYYIASATADVWMTFTAPFDVEKIWVVETMDENTLKNITLTDEDKENGLATKRMKIIQTQAKNNADFASFFGVAMALGSQQTFEEIYDDYLEWARIEDGYEGDPLAYDKRGKVELTPYDGSNWDEANFYLYQNKGDWGLSIDVENDEYEYTTQWDYPTKEGKKLLKQGQTYSMLFPYCTGCWEKDDKGKVLSREFWDYWTGKFLIFESTQGTEDNPHELLGADYVGENRPETEGWVYNDVPTTDDIAVLTGNNTFAFMNTDRDDVLTYDNSTPLSEGFELVASGEIIYPATAFLLANPGTNHEGMPAKRILRTGEIIYETSGNGNNPETGNNHIPTVGGGNDLFITETAGGINVAVAAPQQVRVISSTGAVLYSGMVQTSVDVAIPTTGVYVVAGENEVQKILY